MFGPDKHEVKLWLEGVSKVNMDKLEMLIHQFLWLQEGEQQT